jgi:hypothetical protein
MEHRNVRHRGRPKIHENPAWFGMKISQPEQQKIRRLAKMEGRPASHVIMDLVESELKRKAAPVTLSAREIRKLPEKDRAKILRAAAKMAVEDYKPGGDLYVAGNEDIIEY